MAFGSATTGDADKLSSIANVATCILCTLTLPNVIANPHRPLPGVAVVENRITHKGNASDPRPPPGLRQGRLFNFLGFTFISGKDRRGNFQLKRKTRRDRLRAKLKMVKEAMRRRMHQPIPQQGKWLRQVVLGYFNYHAVPTNFRALQAFRDEITRSWQRTLSRRSQKAGLTWAKMNRLVDDWLPKPRILHPWPDQRFAVTHLR